MDRAAVELRDHQCVFAGCDAPSYWCDVALPGFRVERQPDGRWRTHRSDGTEIVPGRSLLSGV